MVWGEKKIFDTFIGKSTRYHLEDKDRMALLRRRGLTRRDMEAMAPGNINFGPHVRRPPHAPYPPMLMAQCPGCYNRGPAHPAQPQIPMAHIPGCPLFRLRPRPRQRGRIGRLRGRRRRHLRDNYLLDEDDEDDFLDGEYDDEDDDDFDFDDDEEDDDFDLDDDRTTYTRRSYIRDRHGQRGQRGRRPLMGHQGRHGLPLPHGFGGHRGPRMEDMYPGQHPGQYPGQYPGYASGPGDPFMTGGGRRGRDRYGLDDNSTTVSW